MSLRGSLSWRQRCCSSADDRGNPGYKGSGVPPDNIIITGSSCFAQDDIRFLRFGHEYKSFSYPLNIPPEVWVVFSKIFKPTSLSLNHTGRILLPRPSIAMRTFLPMCLLVFENAKAKSL